MVLGIYYMSRERPGAVGEGKRFASPEEVDKAYTEGWVELHAAIKCRIRDKVYDTTVGRVLLYEIIPNEIPFEAVNQIMGKRKLADLIDRAYRETGNKAQTVSKADPDG